MFNTIDGAIALEKDKSKGHRHKLIWQLGTADDAVVLAEAFIAGGECAHIKFGLTIGPTYRFFDCFASAIGCRPHFLDWATMYIVFAGAAEECAALECLLIDKSELSPKVQNEKAGGDGVQEAVPSFVYILINDLSEVVDFVNRNMRRKKQLVQAHQKLQKRIVGAKPRELTFGS